MSARFQAPPGWLVPADGWSPPAGWSPDPSWPAPPPGWQFWVDDEWAPPPVPPRPRGPEDTGPAVSIPG